MSRRLRPPERVEVVTQSGAGPAKAKLEPADLPDTPLHSTQSLLDVRIPADRELWTSLESAAYLRFSTLEAFYSWVHKHHIPRERRGKEALYRKRDLDEALRQDARRVVGKRQLFSMAHTRRV
jgi:hypothetical protein